MPAAAKETRHLTGDAADVKPKLHGPAYNLAGGGGDLAPAMQWMINQVRGCDDCPAKLDVVVLRSTGGAGYNDFIFGMKGVDSVETLVIKRREDSNSEPVSATLRDAEVVLRRGRPVQLRALLQGYGGREGGQTHARPRRRRRR